MSKQNKTTQSFHISSEEQGLRIDKFLSEMIGDDVSRTQVQQLIKDNYVIVNNQPIKSNYKLSLNDEVSVSWPEEKSLDVKAESIPLNVVYEDQDVIIVNKPRGMVVHPALGHTEGTLVNALLAHCKDLSGINGVLRPGIVHRIDKDTSGLIMAAKNDLAHTGLSEQLKNHTVTRTYIAFVHGSVGPEQGTIDAPLGRDPENRKMYTVTHKNSKHAVTHFVVMERFTDYSQLSLKLETGRTHQIRAHMKFIGHPLVGDPLYGRREKLDLPIKGQALHAAVLGFLHPRTGEYLEFSAEIPEDMRNLQSFLRSLP